MSQNKQPWKTLSKKIIYDNPWIHVEEHDVINPGGHAAIYGVVQFKNYALGVIPIDSKGNVYLIGQHRYPFNEYTWEIPEGGGNKNEDPLFNIQRELREEAGLIADTWTLLQEIHVSNSVSDEYGYIYLAQNLTPCDPDPDDDEDLKILKIPFAEAYQMLEDGKIKDSLTVIALLKAKIVLGL